MSKPLSPAQSRLLRLVAEEPVEIQAAAKKLNTTVAGISNTRTMLRNIGYIEDWRLWQGPIIITDEGRAALEREGKL